MKTIVSAILFRGQVRRASDIIVALKDSIGTQTVPQTVDAGAVTDHLVSALAHLDDAAGILSRVIGEKETARTTTQSLSGFPFDQ